jgi:ribosomal protein S18 acetylase RimI-like enzyme
MGQASPFIRPGSPDPEEGAACARYLDEAAEGFIRFIYGRRYERIIAKAYIQPGNQYSFENVVFAERDGGLVGMALGFSAEQRASFSEDVIREAQGSAAFRIRMVMTIFAPIMRIIESLSAGDYYVLAIAVDRERRGEGIGSRLMDAMVGRARDAGCVRLALDVAAKNEGALRMYERRGMKIESQWPKRLAIPGMRFFRMTGPI